MALKINVIESHRDNFNTMWNSTLQELDRTTPYDVVAWYAGDVFYDTLRDTCDKYADARNFNACKNYMQKRIREWNGDLSEDINAAITYARGVTPTSNREFEVDGSPYKIVPSVVNGECSFCIMKNTPDMVRNPGIRSHADIVASTKFKRDVADALIDLETLLEDTFN